jgi:hypothetical protein
MQLVENFVLKVMFVTEFDKAKVARYCQLGVNVFYIPIPRSQTRRETLIQTSDQSPLQEAQQDDGWPIFISFPFTIQLKATQGYCEIGDLRRGSPSPQKIW